MTNPEAKQQYEGAILNQLVKNAEKLAVIEFDLKQVKPKIDKIDVLENKIDVLENKIDVLENKVDVLENKIDVLENKVDNLEEKVDKIYSTLGTLKWISVTIGIGVIINIFSQPIVSWLF